jgi:hypothetical protein
MKGRQLPHLVEPTTTEPKVGVQNTGQTGIFYIQKMTGARVFETSIFCYGEDSIRHVLYEIDGARPSHQTHVSCELASVP